MCKQSISTSSPKILIVSDNPDLSSHVIALLASEPQVKNLAYELRYSYRNHSPESMKALGATSIDLSDEIEIENISNSFNVIFSLHCKQIFPTKLVNNVTCINVHPGYNPYNRGWYPQVFSIINKLPVGVTIHLMNSEIDHGPIIYQQKVPTHEHETSFEVYKKIIAKEKEMLNKHFSNLVCGDYQTFSAEHNGNYNSITDFNNLCELNLDNIGSLKEHIDLMRALSHDGFKNAYFISSDGKKNYINITITSE